MKNVNVFFFPFAGGSKYSYNNYVKNSPPGLTIHPVELPGRGSRIGELLLRRIEDMVSDVFSQIRNRLDKPYAIYGHSMGSYIAFLVAHRIRDEGLPEPMHLLLSGSGGPSVPEDEDYEPTYLLSKERFIEKLKSLGGSTDEILLDPGIMEFYEPILRADFQVVETFNYSPLRKLDVPITLFTGRSETITPEEARAWALETTGDFEWIQYEGKHFFIFENEQSILKDIENKLTNKR
jgi:surfactin synthase thioesterase subunit